MIAVEVGGARLSEVEEDTAQLIEVGEARAQLIEVAGVEEEAGSEAALRRDRLEVVVLEVDLPEVVLVVVLEVGHPEVVVVVVHLGEAEAEASVAEDPGTSEGE